MDNFITHQNWRYATKKFDSTKKIEKADLDFLKEAIRLSVSSYGLQPYQILIIENPIVKEAIKNAAYNQSQITDASHLFVFANYVNFTAQHIDQYIDNTAKTRKIDSQSIQGYGDFMKRTLLNQSTEDLNIWSAKQTYIALTNLVNAAAERKIDVTPMEGFVSDQVNSILDLNSKNLNAVLIAPAGFRALDDETQHLNKVRKASTDLFIEI